MRRLVAAILGKDDLELARSIHDDEMAAVVRDGGEERSHRSAAEVFEVGTRRLMCALSRYAYQLVRDGNPTRRN